MAFLDVSDVLLDPDFTDTFTAIRRKESVGANGRSTTNDVPTNTFGVITAASASDLNRVSDDDTFRRLISVVTKYKLQGEVVGFKPDLIVWRGDNYIVREIDLYPQFGAGFIQAICSSEDLVDQPT